MSRKCLPIIESEHLLQVCVTRYDANPARCPYFAYREYSLRYRGRSKKREMGVDLDAVRRQVEYYFSDSNLPRDKFLRAKTEENEDGYVELTTLLNFNRLAKLGATPALIANAVKGSELVGLDDTRTRIRRMMPLPEEPEWRNRSIYAKGWNASAAEPTIEDVDRLFSPSGDVLSVRIRRWRDDAGERHFKGSVFVEFHTAEAAERAAAEEYKIDTVDDKGRKTRVALTTLHIDAYFDKKRQEVRERRQRKSQARADAPPKVGETATAPVNGEKKTGNGTQARKREMEPGMVLRFENFGPSVTREDIKEAFESFGEIAWVDFQKDDADGHIRFSREGAAETAAKNMTETKTMFGQKLPSFSVLSGDAEEAYWKELWRKQDEVMDRSRKRRRDQGGRGGGGKRFRGGRGRGRGRGGRK